MRALLARGARVRVLDDFSTGRREHLEEVLADVELHQGDVREPQACAAALAGGVEVVFHQAALPSVAASLERPLLAHEVNATGTLVLLQAARAAGVPRLVYASSSSVYGDAVPLPAREDAAPRPLSPYAASKLAGEYYVRLAASLYGMHTVALRYFNVFGPRQDPASAYAAVIPRFIARMRAGQRPVIFGDGRQSRDFTYVEDVVAANLLAAEAGPECAGQVYNVGSGRRHDLLELVAVLNRLLGTALPPEHAPARPGDVRHSQADIARAGRELGYRPRVEFTEGLRRTLAAWR
ncbi:MAG: GDP-mannose 4,6-dehydratase [Planctomycetota bacterium]|nr:MAG: GDP-mannose 4,6-dehydratase [Planctomycetota bacterium]